MGLRMEARVGKLFRQGLGDQYPSLLEPLVRERLDFGRDLDDQDIGIGFAVGACICGLHQYGSSACPEPTRTAPSALGASHRSVGR